MLRYGSMHYCHYANCKLIIVISFRTLSYVNKPCHNEPASQVIAPTLRIVLRQGYKQLPSALCCRLSVTTPSPDQWSKEDKINFQEAFRVHGKSFRSIRQMLPHKSHGDLMNYYYRLVASTTFWLRTTISDIAAGRGPR